MILISSTYLSNVKVLLLACVTFAVSGNLIFTITPQYAEIGESIVVSCHGVVTSGDNIFYDTKFFPDTDTSYCTRDCYFETEKCWPNDSIVGPCYCNGKETTQTVCPGTSNVTYQVLAVDEIMFNRWSCGLTGGDQPKTFILHRFVEGSFANLPNTTEAILDTPFTYTCEYMLDPSPQPTPTFKWVRNGEDYTDSAVLHIDKIQKSNVGVYTCVATQDRGGELLVKEANLTLIVKYAPEVTIGHCSPTHEAEKGTAVTLECIVQEASPEVTSFSWYRLDSSTPDPDQTSSTYIVSSSIQPADEGMYSCKGHNGVGDGNKASLQVVVNFSPENTEINNTNDNTVFEVMEGTSLYLLCEADAKPTATYQWSGEITYIGALLTVPKIEYTQSGTYTCTADNSFTTCGGSKITAPDTVSSQVQVLHTPKGQPSLSFESNLVCVQDDVLVSCQLDVHDSQGYPYATWILLSLENSNHTMDNTTFNNTHGNIIKVDWTYNFISVKESGSYTCVPGNWIGTGVLLSEPKEITIEALPTIEKNTSNTNTPKYNGENPDALTMDCLISASKKGDIYWTVNGQTITKDDFEISESGPISGNYSFGLNKAVNSQLKWRAHEKYLTCDNVTMYDGYYKCHSSDTTVCQSGTVESSFPIRIQTHYAAIWKAQNNFTVAEFGDVNFELLCDICNKSEDTETYQWYFNNTPIEDANSQVYTIDSIEETHFGLYHCEVNNSVGTAKFPIILLESGPAGTPENMTVLPNVTSSSLTLTWVVSRNGNWPPLNHTVDLMTSVQTGECNTSTQYTQWLSTSDDVDAGTVFTMILEPLNQSTVYDIRLQAANQRSNRDGSSAYVFSCGASTKGAPEFTGWDVKLDSHELTITWELLSQWTIDDYVGLAFVYNGEDISEKRYPEEGSTDANVGKVTISGSFSSDITYIVSAWMYEGNNEVGVLVNEEDFLLAHSGSTGAIVGGVIGLLVIIALIVVVVGLVMRRKDIQDKYNDWRQKENKPLTSNNREAANEWNGDIECNGFTNGGYDPYEQTEIIGEDKQPLKASAGIEKTAAGQPVLQSEDQADVSKLYAQVDKPKKKDKPGKQKQLPPLYENVEKAKKNKPQQETDVSLLYAEVNKPKKKDKPGKNKGESLLYAEVQKPKKKYKPGKNKGIQETNVDEDSNQTINVTLAATVTVNQSPTTAKPVLKPKPTKGVKEQQAPEDTTEPELTYISLEFPKQKPLKKGIKPVIHGDDDRTVYAQVDFQKTAEYQPEDDPPPYQEQTEEDVMGELPPKRGDE